MRSLLVSLTVPFVYLFGAGIAPALWGVLGDAGRFDLGFVLFGAAALAFGLLAAVVGVGRVRRVGRSIR